MKLADYTPEQQALIQANDPRMIVRASAGSGKTTVLVARYIRHVTEQGLTPDEVWTVTYTRKAAAEMKRRIVRDLNELGHRDVAQRAETGPIQTIHSACERILRENALAAGLDPDFEVIEGHERSVLFREALRSSVQELMSESSAVSRLVDHLAGAQLYGFGPSLDSALEQAVTRLTDKLRPAGLDAGVLSPDYADKDAVTRLWSRAMTAEARAKWPEAPEVVDAASAKAVAEGLAERRLGTPSWLRDFSSDDGAELTAGVVQLAIACWRRLEELMAERQAFDFHALESLAVRLIDDDSGVRARVSRQVRALLVDEAQDLNPNQYRLIDAIDAPHKMLVGDFQQSIYRFRDAEPYLFLDRANEWPVYPLSVNHRSNKAVLDLVDRVFGLWWGDGLNRMEASLLADAPPPQAIELWEVGPQDTEGLARLVKQLVDEGESPGSITVLCRTNKEMSQIARRLARHQVPHQVQGGSETLYTRLEVRDIGNALRALVDPEDDDALACLLHSPFVGVSLDCVVSALAKARPGPSLENEPARPLIKALEECEPIDPGDAAALAEFRRWFEPMRRRATRVSVWETVSALFAETRYLVALAEGQDADQRLANVRKLLSIAIDRPELSPLDFADQIREIQRLRHREGLAEALDEGADAVTLMTVHAAKGLEFDTVVVPDTLKISRQRPEVVVQARLGLVAARFDRAGSAFNMILEGERRLEGDEMKRLFYVAMTRAKRKLCIASGEGANPLAAAVAQAVGHPRNLTMSVHVRKVPDV